jgi:hypothetical protein
MSVANALTIYSDFLCVKGKGYRQISNRLTFNMNVEPIAAIEVLTMLLPIFKLCFNEQKSHLQLY